MSIARLHLSRWLLFSLLAVVAWGLWAFQAKLVSGPGEWKLDPYVNHVLSTAGLLLMLPFLALRGLAATRAAPARPGAGRGLAAGLLSGVLGSAGNILLYESMRRGGLASLVVPLTGLYPVVTVLLAVTLLRERLGLGQLLGLPVAFAAIGLLSVVPSPEEAGAFRLGLLAQPWSLLAAGALAAWGVSGVLQKVASGLVSAARLFVAFACGYVVTAGCLLAIESQDWGAVTFTAGLLGLAGGILNGLGALSVFAALSSGGKASVVTPLTALYPIVAIILSWTLLGERLVPVHMAGAAAALVAGALLAREKE
ncbi:MAG: EamA family transporter [Planctomycetes bacterium]|nr:EamA family transporter [Planctomycetota bacterium]